MALSLGRRGLGRVWPNPNVGCVIVRDGRVIGRGWTADGGRPHAETQALSGIDASGATAYVTLEPCAHHGKTPPCVDSLIAANVARVVIATGDPDPRVGGKGIAKLRTAGIEVQVGPREAEARADMAGFLLRVTQKRPFLTLKLAASFDGRIATATGESQWITGPKARRHVHAMRARHDAVLVGAGTVRADDPSLTVRDLGMTDQPVRVVATSNLNVAAKSLLATQNIAPLWLCHGAESDATTWADTGATLIACNLQHQQLDPVDMMEKLANAGLTRVFCEGGGRLAASLLNAGLVDEIVGYTAGLSLGATGTPSVGELYVPKLSDVERFTLAESRQIGADLMHRWTRSLAASDQIN